MDSAQQCAKYQYVVTSNGPKILPVLDPSYKDEESPADYNAGGYLPVKVADTFKEGRYRVVRKLGDHVHSALKVVKSAGRYAETARDEIKLLSRVASVSPTHPGRQHIVSFLDSFVTQGPESPHVCIVFEPLGENLLGLIERNKKKGVPKALVRIIAKQILLGLQYLHDECDLVHTDIKPENILIAIPDIETHINAELSSSPTPIARRVGVPLPTRTRTGVSIPHNQQTFRRQVQIFNSQPLSSPRGSFVDLARSVPGSLKLSAIPLPEMHEHENNVHHAKTPGYGTTSASGTAKSLSSAASKFTSGLTASAPQPLPKPDLLVDQKIIPQKRNPLSLSSSSSSSSSISSTSASLAAGTSSAISTPPTSLSHSLGIAVAGFVRIPKPDDSSILYHHAFSTDNQLTANSRGELPVNVRDEKRKSRVEVEEKPESATSWADTICKPRSWSEKILPVLSSSFKSQNLTSHGSSKLCYVQPSHHSHPRSGLPSSTYWKDPGTAPPAPAVVVSAVAAADHGEDIQESFDFPPANTPGRTSETSSAATTITQPSRTTTPVHRSSPSKKPPSLIKKVILNTLPDVSAQPLEGNVLPAHTHTPAKSTPSLLSQTAPTRPASLKTTTMSKTSRSPPQQVSFLSAHKSVILTSTATPDRSSPTTAASNPSTSIERLSLTVPVPPSPCAPPPTPVESPSTPPPVHPPSSSASQTILPIQVPLPPISGLPVIHPPISIKIADLGNATPSKKHYTEDIQTRQYRAPEAILGRRDWDARADIWSIACVVFELLTSEFLFDPHGQGERFTKDDDHMAQIIELLGDFPLEVKMGGKYSRELFDHAGKLRYIHELRPWPLHRVMMEKYMYPERDAVALADFLLPMLAVDMRERSHARDMLDHRWLSPCLDDEELFDCPATAPKVYQCLTYSRMVADRDHRLAVEGLISYRSEAE
ncbi:hypothetical protein H0H93_012020 [Arthromyces matolae]|nr:hypothetical protein H0H93_012020 [Arthromyces matolae]